MFWVGAVVGFVFAVPLTLIFFGLLPDHSEDVVRGPTSEMCPECGEWFFPKGDVLNG